MTDASTNNGVNWKNCFIAVLLAIIAGLLLLNLRGCEGGGGAIKGEDGDGKTIVINDDETVRQLKKNEQELYDALKQRDLRISDLEYALRVEYGRKSNFDTVFIVKTVHDTVLGGLDVKTFSYNGGDKDSVRYSLSIGSVAEPDWYKLDFEVNDNIIIANEENGESNKTTVFTTNGGDIVDVDTYNKKKGRFWKNVCVGPSIGIGYDFANNKFGPSVGISVSYDVFGKLKDK